MRTGTWLDRAGSGLTVLALGLVVGLTGCGDDGGSGGGDSGTPMDDGGTSDAGGGGTDGGGGGGNPDVPDNLPAARVDAMADDPDGTGSAADYSCLGARTAPAGGEEIDFTLQLRDFQESDRAVEGACVEFYSDNLIPAAAGACSGAVTDANGEISVTGLAGGFYAYHVFAPDDPSAEEEPWIDLMQINEVAPMAAGETVTATSISQSTAGLIPVLLQATRAPGTAFLAGMVHDCTIGDATPKTVYGAVVRVAKLDGTYIEAGSERLSPRYHYFNGDPEMTLPSMTQQFTNTDGLYLALNLPVAEGGEELFVEIWGRTEAGADPQILACEQVRVFPDSGGLVNMGPVRSDGPACPGLD